MIVLDFDGVLFDTIKESYAVSMIARNSTLSLGSINFNTDHYKRFERLRHLVGPAKDYYKVLNLLDAGKCAEDLSEVASDQLADEIFSRDFYRVRNKLIEDSFYEWARLNKPYNFFKWLSKLSGEKFIILTNKDESAVLKLLSYFNPKFDYEIIDNRFLGKFSSKFEVLNYLSNKESLIYIDDNVNYINEAKNIANINCYLAGWGYVKKDAKDKYTQKNIFKIIIKRLGERIV